MIKKKISKKNNVIDFPAKLSQIEKEIEAIIFAAAEPLDIETIQSKISIVFVPKATPLISSISALVTG